MAKKVVDEYTQVITAQVDLGGGVDDNYQVPVTTSYAPQDPIAFVLQRVEYILSNRPQILLDTTGDSFRFGLSFIYTPPEGGWQGYEQGIIDYNTLYRVDTAAPAANVVDFDGDPQVVKDWTGLSSKGRLVHPCNFFLWTYTTTALAAAAYVYARIDYTIIDLGTMENELYKELWQAIQIRQQYP